jgi:hypothetical protein
MTRKLDLFKLKFSDKSISIECALKDVEPWIDVEDENNSIETIDNKINK